MRSLAGVEVRSKREREREGEAAGIAFPWILYHTPRTQMLNRIKRSVTDSWMENPAIPLFSSSNGRGYVSHPDLQIKLVRNTHTEQASAIVGWLANRVSDNRSKELKRPLANPDHEQPCLAEDIGATQFVRPFLY
jgi:hypothetical protein